jgi:hypothetical protein
VPDLLVCPNSDCPSPTPMGRVVTLVMQLATVRGREFGWFYAVPEQP